LLAAGSLVLSTKSRRVGRTHVHRFDVRELPHAVAVDLKLLLPIVVVNKCGYGEVRQAMVSRGIEPFGVTFDPPRFPLVAEAFGARGELVSEPSQLERALRAAFEADGRR
jgi:thiamine pyrophosphate-dependent acetolactate synthase large subunit-like protein